MEVVLYPGQPPITLPDSALPGMSAFGPIVGEYNPNGLPYQPPSMYENRPYWSIYDPTLWPQKYPAGQGVAQTAPSTTAAETTGGGSGIPGSMASKTGTDQQVASLFQGLFQPNSPPSLGELLLPIFMGVPNAKR